MSENGRFRTHAGDRYSHWCSNGCGKRVRWNKKKTRFECSVCKKKFKNKEEMNKLWEAEI